MSTYDYLVVGSGLYGATFAWEMTQAGKKCLVLEKRKQIGGNVSTEERDGITIHSYGAHIFHTSNKETWDFFQSFSPCNHYVNSPIANWHGKLYNLPFNMNTFYELWGTETPKEAKRMLEAQRIPCENPKNLEEQALTLAGRDIYERLIKDYTEKQWGRDCTELPPSIITRIPFRMRYDNNYFNDPYQGIPIKGYTAIIEKMLAGSEVRLGVDFNDNQKGWKEMADKVVYTGPLDAYGKYVYGKLSFRSEKFELEKYEEENHQGVAVMNYTSHDEPYTRSIEHKHFAFTESPVTWVSYEYPVDYEETGEPYYPIGDQENLALQKQYKAKADEDGILTGGRLAEYRYYDMDKTIIAARNLARKELGQ
jgi:UDP-galactopyranose mutase